MCLQTQSSGGKYQLMKAEKLTETVLTEQSAEAHIIRRVIETVKIE